VERGYRVGVNIGETPAEVKRWVRDNATKLNNFLIDFEAHDGIVDNGTPASASDTGTEGTILWDDNYIYICIATDTWKRVAISTW
jgi:hypothetical protein